MVTEPQRDIVAETYVEQAESLVNCASEVARRKLFENIPWSNIRPHVRNWLNVAAFALATALGSKDEAVRARVRLILKDPKNALLATNQVLRQKVDRILTNPDIAQSQFLDVQTCFSDVLQAYIDGLVVGPSLQ